MNVLRAYTVVLALFAGAALHAQTYQNEAEYDHWKASLPGVAHQVFDTHIEAPEARGTEPGLQLRGGSQATCECWHEPDASYSTINNNTQWNASGFNSSDDGSYGPVALPFSYYLYGQYYNACYINTNGNISFGDYVTSFTANGFPVTGDTLVGAFWADVDLGGIGVNVNQVKFKVTPHALYVNWINVGYYPDRTDKLNTFQIVITDGTDPVVPDGANTSFCYQDMQWTTGSANCFDAGTQTCTYGANSYSCNDSGGNGYGFCGNAANVGANKGDGVNYIQFGRFDHPGTDYDGPFGASDGVSFLDNKNFRFATDISTGNVPPVITGQSVCDTVILCAGQTQQITMDFLSPEPDQTTVPTATCLTLPSFSIVSATSGVAAEIVTEFTPTAADIGYHHVIFQGTDDGLPIMTSTIDVVVWVQVSASMEPGDTTVCSAGAPFQLYDLLGGIPYPGGVWTDPDGATHSGTFVPGTDPAGEYLYELGSVGSDCYSSSTVNVTVLPSGDAGSDGTASYCTSDATDNLFTHLGGTPDAGGQWQDPQGANITGVIDPATAAAGAYTYTVPGTAPCANVQATIAVTISQKAEPGQNAQLTLCADAAPITLLDALNGSPANNGTWTAPAGSAFGPVFTPGTDAPGAYTYTIVPQAPCPTLSSTLDIAVDPRPKAGTDGSVELCANASTTPLFTHLGGSPDQNGTWSDPAGAAHSGVLDPALEVSGSYTYVVTGPGTCAHLSDTSVVEVTVDPVPVISFTADPDSGCDPLTVRFTNTTDSAFIGTSCVWDLGDEGATVNECGTFTHEYGQAGWYNVRLTVTSPEGCTDHYIKQGAVLVEPAPKATMNWAPELATEELHELLFTADDPHASRFVWTLNGDTMSTQRQFGHDFPHVLGGDYRICLAVADRYGCADTACNTVHVIIPSLFVPTSFTPNGDGYNEVFKPIGRDMVEGEHELMIFDRWGQLVFDSVDPDEGWNGGQGNAGAILPEGVYTWRLIERPIGTANKKDWFGTVTLLK